MVRWVDGFSPELIAARIEKSKTINADGSAAFSVFEHTEHIAILASMLRLNLVIPESERFEIINRATSLAARMGIVTAESIRTQVNLGEKIILSNRSNAFDLSRLSLSPFQPTHKFSL